MQTFIFPTIFGAGNLANLPLNKGLRIALVLVFHLATNNPKAYKKCNLNSKR
jgi:hypothetical protein